MNNTNQSGRARNIPEAEVVSEAEDAFAEVCKSEGVDNFRKSLVPAFYQSTRVIKTDTHTILKAIRVNRGVKKGQEGHVVSDYYVFSKAARQWIKFASKDKAKKITIATLLDKLFSPSLGIIGGAILSVWQLCAEHKESDKFEVTPDKRLMLFVLASFVGNHSKDMFFTMGDHVQQIIEQRDEYSSFDMGLQFGLLIMWLGVFYETVAGVAGDGSILTKDLKEQGLDQGVRIFASIIVGCVGFGLINFLQKLLNERIINRLDEKATQKLQFLNQVRKWGLETQLGYHNHDNEVILEQLAALAVSSNGTSTNDNNDGYYKMEKGERNDNWMSKNF